MHKKYPDYKIIAHPESEEHILKTATYIGPDSHYLCGDIVVNKNEKTTINNLFSCGLTSKTGLHRASRLASNSLLEALVYAHNIYKSLSETKSRQIKIPAWNDNGTRITEEHILIQHNLKELQALIRDYVGIVRSNNHLTKAITHKLV